jgi:hypothetical protein
MLISKNMGIQSPIHSSSSLIGLPSPPFGFCLQGTHQRDAMSRTEAATTLSVHGILFEVELAGKV